MDEQKPKRNGYLLRRAGATVCLLFVLFAAVLPSAVSAQVVQVVTAPGVPIETTEDLKKELIEKPFQVAFLTIIWNFMTFISNRIAYDAAVAIATAGNGEEPLIELRDPMRYLEDLGKDVVGAGIDALNQSLEAVNIHFDLCAPKAPLVKLSLQLGIRSAYDRPEPDCDFQELTENWEAFTASTIFSASPDEAALFQFSATMNPRTTDLSSAITLLDQIYTDEALTKSSSFAEYLANNGYKNVVNSITGNVETPADLVENAWSRSVEIAIPTKEDRIAGFNFFLESKDLWKQLGVSALSTFANTLLSTFTQRIYSGMFDIDIPESDVLDVGTITFRGGVDAAESHFRSMFTAKIISLDNYSVISEFLTCPGTTTRQLNNCVMDSGFGNAVAGAEVGDPFTVQEAIDEGYIHGDWPLISQDDSRDLDQNCYSYGYCYGNLVRMRKARIIPVGWEMAASIQAAGDSDTLQDVIDQFDDCNADNERDPSHPYCHLIDPNWVLKYPSTQCRASVPGQLVDNDGIKRGTECVDAPSCIQEDAGGECVGGYGYCVREQNSFDFRGTSCPEQYATCLAVSNEDDELSGNYLFNTTDLEECDADSAGCRWYQTTKESTDDVFDWPTIDDLPTLDAAAGTYASRFYYNNDVEECDSDDAGCTRVIEKTDDVTLNLIRNPSFEDDEDADGVPDYWTFTGAGTYDLSGTTSAFASDSVAPGASGSSAIIYQTDLPLQQATFYTLSFYAEQADATSSETLTVYAVINSEDGSAEVDLSGTSYGGDCTIADLDSSGGEETILMSVTPASNTSERFSCTFTSPTFTDEDLGVRIQFLDFIGEEIYVDAVQLEADEDLSDFVVGYGTTLEQLNPTYYKLPPSYLGCTGDSDVDPAECADYAPVCTAQDVGCSEYTPENGDPVVTGIAGALDECPAVCSGYDTYKQEPTRYEPDGDFPLYFIPDTAISCGAQYVGCDEFTNLNTEERESYTYLRACQTTTQTTDEATYYTWEGSDLEGFQLVSWSLMQSDTTDAPCTTWSTTSSAIECADLSTAGTDDACDEHDDIFENPDCREFYDADGDIFYRLWSETVTVTDSCTPYRKTQIVGDDATEQASNCSGAGGYWDGTVGECNFYGYADESDECPATANGCREYTGGNSRNSSVVYEDDVEDEDIDEYIVNATTTTAEVSNESVATDGHSIHVEMSADDGYVAVASATMADCSESDGCTADTADEDADGSTADCGESDGCDAEVGTLGVSCTISEGDATCGALTGELAEGKVYILKFWAKTTTSSLVITPVFIEQAGTGDEYQFDTVTLSPIWKEYTVGPLDTTDESGFDDSALLAFMADSGAEFYLDNITLRQTEENITVIKDSWETPATCDETEDGVSSDQYHLGCQEYRDQDGETVYLKSFTRLCDEDQVGCAAFYDTQSSDSVYGAVYNITCEAVTSAGIGGACEIDGEEVCDMAAGESSCQFDWIGGVPREDDGTLKDLDSTDYQLALNADAVVVPPDEVTYFVASDTYACDEGAMGCMEVGVPTYNQDQSQVASWETSYLLNVVDAYDDILCNVDTLFCEAWDTTQNGTYYFKYPQDKTCEYRTGVVIDGSEYSGWFRTDTDQFCYGSGTCSDDATVSCSLDADCASADAGTCEINDGSYVQGGTFSGVWRNGDTAFDGWVGTCDDEYDLCSEFIDTLDVGENGLYGTDGGSSSFFLNNDELDESNLPASKQCSGQVSQKQGCILFNDTLDSELNYNASATYTLSVHANEFYSGTMTYGLVDPISCPDSGVVETLSGTSYDLCAMRCTYRNDLLHPYEDYSTTTGEDFYTFTTSCIYDSDCPLIESDGSDLVDGTCETGTFTGAGSSGSITVPTLEDDTNRIQKVNLDRDCAEWLSCSSQTTVWDESASAYKTVCDGIGMCNEYSSLGETSFCTNWNIDASPTLLTSNHYASRDIGWYGYEYAGYAVPYSLPAHLLSQKNVNPSKWCTYSTADGSVYDGRDYGYETPFIDCSADDGMCDDATGSTSAVCSSAPTDYRLVYDAGTCDEENGESCEVGFCASSGASCGTDSDCDSGDTCETGYCGYAASSGTCEVDADCTDSVYNTCNNNLCTTLTAEACSVSSECTNTSLGTATCIDSATSMDGMCFENECLVDVSDRDEDGNLDDFDYDLAEALDCRGWPESSAPFPNEVVTIWQNADGATDATPDGDENAITTLSTFEDVNLCAGGEECLCNYDVVEYGTGKTWYYDQASDAIPTYKCVGGLYDGGECDATAGGAMVIDDVIQTELCSEGSGVCTRLSSQQTMIGLEGYCLERDTSLTLNGQTGEAPCLTWLPVDRPAGATDIYGKATEAGYPLEDTFYCGDIDLYMDVPTSSIGCAQHETSSGGQDCNYVSSTEDPYWGDLLRGDGNAVCPDGMFAVIGRCIDSDGKTDGDFDDPYASSSGNSAVDTCMADAADDSNDHPYFCVPEGSVHTEGIDEGDLCDIPDDDLLNDFGAALNEVKESDWDYDDVWDINGTWGQMETVASSLSLGNDVYKIEAQPDEFDTLYEYYSDCVLEGVDYLSTKNNPYLIPTPDNLLSGSYYTCSNSSGPSREAAVCADGNYDNRDLVSEVENSYHDLTFGTVVYPGCSSIVQVASTTENRAWTDRVLFDGRAYAIDQFSSASLAFTMDTVENPFGVSVSPTYLNEEIDPNPARPLSCLGDIDGDGYDDIYLPNVSGSCGSGSLISDGLNQGRAYDDFDGETGGYIMVSDSENLRPDQVLFGLISPSTAWENAISEIFAFANTWSRFDQGLDDDDDFESIGSYSTLAESSGLWDITDSGDSNIEDGNPTAPVVRAVGETCVDQYCREGVEDTFSVNGQDDSDLTGDGGQFFADVKFFVEANANQMPIRRVIVDWQDQRDTMSGSLTDDNYYKNRRGLNDSNNHWCEQETNWGETAEACEPNYFNTTNVYTCSMALVETLPVCSTNDSGNLEESPCRGGDSGYSEDVCIFQPRVHVRDNWGWCTGVCGTDGESCYDGDGEIMTNDSTDECNLDYPNADMTAWDPWVYYEGLIIVEP